MKPIRFECRETLPLTPNVIAEQVLDLTRWPASQRWGPVRIIESMELLRIETALGRTT